MTYIMEPIPSNVTRNIKNPLSNSSLGVEHIADKKLISDALETCRNSPWNEDRIFKLKNKVEIICRASERYWNDPEIMAEIAVAEVVSASKADPKTEYQEGMLATLIERE